VLRATLGHRGMVVAPHHLAAAAGADILREGGNAIEAMIAAAASIAVVYPHMNGLGGDNFWLIHRPGEVPIGIDACGAAAGLADIGFYREQGIEEIPARGPLAALTMAGAVSGWQNAHQVSVDRCEGRLPLSRLLESAIDQAEGGIAVTETLATNCKASLAQMDGLQGFSDRYLKSGAPLSTGDRLTQPVLASTLRTLAQQGLESFYRGDLATSLADDLESAGSPLRLTDFHRHQSLRVTPLTLEVAGHRLLNMPPPTQGLASLLLIGAYDRLGITEAEGFDFVHGLVEATKGAFRVRDAHICDPAHMPHDVESLLSATTIDDIASKINRHHAAAWPAATPGGDTVWLGAIDAEGRAVSFIQSLYWEFGSGVVLPQSGITWQNRGTSFSLAPKHLNRLEPYKRPFHTIQPALALLDDGRVMVYGSMGGDGQPQTQAIIFARHIMYGQELQQALTAPRWLLGRTWGSETTNLRIENRFNTPLYDALRHAGHDVEVIGAFEEVMGHAGALVRHSSGLIEGASDPRSDGAAQAV
jgi:gamma-glutamyltranspeptidase